jgi:hypothetical protein
MSSHSPAPVGEVELAPPTPAAPAPWWRRALPFALALGLIAFTLSRIDFHAFAARLAAVNAPAFVAFSIAFVLALLTADAFATVIVYRRDVARVRFVDFWVLRGASYLPSLLNHHVGQAFITVYMAREHGVSLARMAGATLLVYVSWSGCILGIGCLALFFTGQSLQWIAMVLGAGVLYLAVIALRPAPLARIRFLAPLFEAGLAGHLVALVVRLPHLAVLFFGTWLPFRFFGVDIPLGAALTYVPILMVAVTLPLTPQGVGTREALAGRFFASYAPGETADAKLAAIVAVTASCAVTLTLAEALIGLVLLRRLAPGDRKALGSS